MADSDSHLGLASGLFPQTPSLGPSSRPSTDDARSQDQLLSRNVASDVPDAPPRVQEVPAENPTHATNRRLG